MLLDISGQIATGTIIVGKFYSPLSLIDILPKQNVSKETINVNHRSNELNRHLQNIPSSSCGIHILLSNTKNFLKYRSISDHKASFNKHKIIETILVYEITIKYN
jgi:hypothetical protein